LEALRWLANRRASLGLGLAAGAFVSLGSITPVQWLDQPAHGAIEIEQLGKVEVRLV
jgi:2-keto-4-pentenoate hydratase